MKRLTERATRILAWRWGQPVLVRWFAALLFFAAALLTRTALGTLHGANPALAFYPAILLVAVLIGWVEAVVVLCLSVGAGFFLFLPNNMYLQPIGWLMVGGLNIAIIAVLKGVARELAAVNERQQILFQELQHRVANTLQAVGGTLAVARRRVGSSPDEAVQMLDEAARRIAASADVHRRLNDPTLFERSLGSILQDAVGSVIDRHRVSMTFDVESLDLSFDQMSNVTMLVTEIANNAQKHVFQYGWGSSFSVSLRAVADDRAMLAIRDDGPGGAGGSEVGQRRLGFKLIRALTAQLGGSFTLTPGEGTEIVIEFPLRRASRPAVRRLVPGGVRGVVGAGQAVQRR
jgi:two-component sensor histidine kinase